jgi:site-specific DNA recombinase
VIVIERAEQCAPYGRVSSDVQHDSETINSQKRLLLKDISSRDDPTLAVKDQRKLVAEFWDDPCSGTIPFEDRPEGKRLVNAICSRGNIDCDGTCNATDVVIDTVWVTKLDRLARRLQILIEIEGFFRRHRVGLRCLEHDINTATPTGGLIFTILGAIAQWEREVILERTASGKRTKASEGKFMGGRRTFGLKTDEHGYLVVDDTLIGKTGKMAYEIVREIFENIVNGSSLEREAERYGLTTRRVGVMLHNPRYKGQGGMFQKGAWIEAEKNKPPQVVSPETWELAQDALLDNRRLSSRNRKYEYLVSQLMICAEPKKPSGLCGRVFVGRIVRGKYTYYCCYRKGCTARPLQGDMVEKAVWGQVRRRLTDPEGFLTEALARGSQSEKVRELRMELTSVIDQLSNVESERMSILRNIDKRHYTEAEGEARLAEVLETHNALVDHQTALEIQLRSVTLTQANLRRAGLVSTDIGPELDRIERLAASAHPDEAHRGRARQTVLVKNALDRIEVRNGPQGTTLKLFWRYTDDAQQLSFDLTGSAQASCNRQMVEPILIVTELDLPASCGQGRRTDLESLSREQASVILA